MTTSNIFNSLFDEIDGSKNLDSELRRGLKTTFSKAMTMTRSTEAIDTEDGSPRKLKEEIRLRISGTKKRCTLIKQIVEKTTPVLGWMIGNEKPMEVKSWNQNPIGENAVHEIFIVLFL